VRWRDRYEELNCELLDAWEQDKNDDEHPADRKPTRMDICAAVAEDAWLKDCERWPRESWPASPTDPDALHPDWRRDAATRVLNGIKALQKALIEKVAA
jgi:hypothetical protein